MVVVPFWEHTHRVITYSSCSFLPIPIKRENQREIKVLYRRKIIVSLVLSNIIVMTNSGTLLFTFYNMVISMGYCLWLIIRINNTIIFCVYAYKKNSNPARPTTGWRVKRVGSRIQLIKKIIFFQSKLNCNSN